MLNMKENEKELFNKIINYIEFIRENKYCIGIDEFAVYSDADDLYLTMEIIGGKNNKLNTNLSCCFKYDNLDNDNITFNGLLPGNVFLSLINYYANDSMLKLDKSENRGLKNIKLTICSNSSKSNIIILLGTNITSNRKMCDYNRYNRIIDYYCSLLDVHFSDKFIKNDSFVSYLSDNRLNNIFNRLSLEEKRKLLSYIDLERLYSLDSINSSIENNKLLNHVYKRRK